jgi:hypothetical protein
MAVCKKNDAKAELNRRSQTCEVFCQHRDFASLNDLDGHEGSAPSIPVWKTGVCLSTPMPERKKPERQLRGDDEATDSVDRPTGYKSTKQT